MVKNAVLGKEIALRVANKIGVLAGVSKLIADHGVNIVAVAGYAVEGNNEAEIMMVTDDNLRAADALKKEGYKPKEREVVVIELENKAGALKVVTSKLANEKIDLKYIYGTACAEACPAKLVLSTSDNAKALLVFTKK